MVAVDLRLPKPDIEYGEGDVWPAWSTEDGAGFVKAHSRIDIPPRVVLLEWRMATTPQVDFIRRVWAMIGFGADPITYYPQDGSASWQMLVSDLSIGDEQTGHDRHRVTLRGVEAL